MPGQKKDEIEDVLNDLIGRICEYCSFNITEVDEKEFDGYVLEHKAEINAYIKRVVEDTMKETEDKMLPTYISTTFISMFKAKLAKRTNQ